MAGPSAETWHAVARSEDLTAAHIFHARLNGQELAVWRDDAGRPNVWENRCPHRGVRLTLGHNFGPFLRCQYHGLRFASGTGECIAVPAHPGMTASKSLRARSYSVIERYGLVWTTLIGSESEPRLGRLDNLPIVTMRSVVIRASADEVLEALSKVPKERDSGLFEGAFRRDGFTVFGKLRNPPTDVAMRIQPADTTKSVVHGVVSAPKDQLNGQLRRKFNHWLCRLRDAIEARVATLESDGRTRGEPSA